MKYRILIAEWLINKAIAILPQKRTSNVKTTHFTHWEKTTGYKIIVLIEGGER